MPKIVINLFTVKYEIQEYLMFYVNIFNRKSFTLCFLVSLFFNVSYPTAGVNIYSTNGQQVLILLAKEDKGWSDFTGHASELKDFIYASKQTNKYINKYKILEELNGGYSRPYIATLLKTPPFAEQLFKHSAAREAHEETIGMFLNSENCNINPQQTAEEGTSFFLNKFDENYKINIKIPTQRRNRLHESWFVKVDFISDDTLNQQLSDLKMAHPQLPECFFEKQEYKWVNIRNLIKTENRSLPISSDLDLNTEFKYMIETQEAQAMIQKIINSI